MAADDPANIDAGVALGIDAATWAAENARLRQQLTDAQDVRKAWESAIDDLGARLEAVTKERDHLRGRIDRVGAERGGINPVSFGPHPHGLGEILSVEPTSDAMRSTPADPAGLDAAIEAAWDEYCTRLNDDDRRALEFAVHAAAPHIRRAVLLEAADETRESGLIGSLLWDGWLRERAERETT